MQKKIGKKKEAFDLNLKLKERTLEKGEGEGEEESRRSSTCQPGRVSIKYSEMLLVENWRLLLLLFSCAGAIVLFAGGGVPFETASLLAFDVDADSDGESE